MHGQVVVVFREVLRCIFGREVLLPDDVGDEVVGPEYIVGQGQQAAMFMLVDAGELKEYLIFTAPECFANISLYAVSSHLLTQITDCERMFSTITRTANRTPQ